jgi:hypothetical protein
VFNGVTKITSLVTFTLARKLVITLGENVSRTTDSFVIPRMKDRFTHKNRIGRNRIPWSVRKEIYTRDNYTCQYCGKKFSWENLSIDHIIPLTEKGTDEIINYVTSCQACNKLKGSMSLNEFAKTMNIQVDALPVHGDPIIDNLLLPLQIRILRRKIIERSRLHGTVLKGKRAQYKLEKEFRRAFWDTPEGLSLQTTFPTLPGQVRIMIPEIQAIATNKREFLLLVELAKSANTRNLIGGVISTGSNVEHIVRDIAKKTNDKSLQLRLNQALRRWENAL